MSIFMLVGIFATISSEEQKIRKNRFGCPFFQLKKRSISRSCFFSLFEPSGKPWTLKIKPKRCKGVQKRGSHLFKKSVTFLQKPTQIYLPWDPQRILKMEKVREMTFPKPTSKKPRKNTPNYKENRRRFPPPPPSRLPRQSHPGAPPEQSLS